MIGVLLMAYGTPATPDDIEAYYTHIRRGRPPTPELLADLERRYKAIGGLSPLLEGTRAQSAGLQHALGPAFRVELGMKHAAPLIEEGVATLADAGVERAVGLVLAPHYSQLSVGDYAARAGAAAHERGLAISTVESWHLEPGYLELLADTVLSCAQVAQPATTIFTAHSLPARIRDAGDPYPDQLEETARAVAALAGLDHWTVAWQSAGRTEDLWLGPSVLEVIASRASAGDRGVIVCPAGFVSEHLETLYDLDIEARCVAEAHGLEFARTPTPGTRPAFCEALARVVRRHLDHA